MAYVACLSKATCLLKKMAEGGTVAESLSDDQGRRATWFFCCCFLFFSDCSHVGFQVIPNGHISTVLADGPMPGSEELDRV